jgi:hypothetical protein
MESTSKILTIDELKILVNNINNIAIRKYSEAKKLFESKKIENKEFENYEAVEYKNDYFIISGNTIINIFVSLETIKSIINLKKDKAKRASMFKALKIDMDKEIPQILYIKVAQKYN